MNANHALIHLEALWRMFLSRMQCFARGKEKLCLVSLLPLNPFFCPSPLTTVQIPFLEQTKHKAIVLARENTAIAAISCVFLQYLENKGFGKKLIFPKIIAFRILTVHVSTKNACFPFSNTDETQAVVFWLRLLSESSARGTIPSKDINIFNKGDRNSRAHKMVLLCISTAQQQTSPITPSPSESATAFQDS